jgi:hypothetical protein
MAATVLADGRFQHAAVEKAVQCPCPGKAQHLIDVMRVQIFLIQPIAFQHGFDAAAFAVSHDVALNIDE